MASINYSVGFDSKNMNGGRDRFIAGMVEGAGRSGGGCGSKPADQFLNVLNAPITKRTIEIGIRSGIQVCEQLISRSRS